MPSSKRLRSVCQSFAHHARSGLAWVHPHVVRACRTAGISEMEVGLLDDEPCPERFRGNERLRLSLGALRVKFGFILSNEGWSSKDLVDARLWFSPVPALFSPVPGDGDYCVTARVRLVPKVGEAVECTVDYVGHELPPERDAP